MSLHQLPVGTGIPILTYHSQNIRGNQPADNDHVALAADLAALHEGGKRIIPLDRLMDWLDGTAAEGAVRDAVVITFDDGCDLDVRDIDYPGHGLQRSFLGIMEDLLEHFPSDDRPALHATCFVIASAEARRTIDAASLFGKDWIRDDWWRSADSGGLLAIENHGWDHNHPALAGDARGNFHTVDTHEQCVAQVVRAAEEIEKKTGRRPRYFAYPFGESSSYIRDEFFPEFENLHGCRAALGTEPGAVTRSSNRWSLPRYVCGRDWVSSRELFALLT